MRLKEGNKEKDILEAAIKVFAEDGYYGSKITKIADMAGVATGSVYVYFDNKESLLKRIFDDLWNQLYSELKFVTENKRLSPLEKLDAVIDSIFDLFTENPSLAVVFVNEQPILRRNSQGNFPNYNEKFLDMGEVIIKEGVNSGLVTENIDIKIFRHFILGAIRHLLQQWAEDPKEFSLNKIRQNIKYILKNGIKKV